VFDAIRGLAPDLFIHTGDFHYENIARNSPARFHRAYDDVLASPRQSALYRSTPLVYVWDDHDFGPNNADGTSPSKPAAFSVYRQAVPHYPLGTPDALSVNQAFTLGRVRFIVTDGRSARTPDGTPAGKRTMLGAVQLEWLERELKAAVDAPLVVWVNTVPWITRRKGSSDGWEGYANERTRIANLIKELGLDRRMVMLSGDAHMVAIDDGTNSNYATGAPPGEPAFPVVHAAPMDRRTSEKGGPYTNGISRRRGQFGFMDLTDDGQRLRLELTGRNAGGGVIPRMRIVVTCEESGCRVVESDATR
jgi:phosphodiesterase/alkaline phosphatase D-like protein